MHRPLACVATVAAAWQSLHTAPAPVSVVRCGPCEFVTSVVDVELWHSVQVLVAPIAVFQVYPRIAAALCPLLWHRFVPQVPKLPPPAATTAPPPPCT